MIIEDNKFSIVALTPYSFGTGKTVSEAIKHARLNIIWKKINPLEEIATITVYLCSPETLVDNTTGGLKFPKDQEPILIDMLETRRPTKLRKIKG